MKSKNKSVKLLALKQKLKEIPKNSNLLTQDFVNQCKDLSVDEQVALSQSFMALMGKYKPTLLQTGERELKTPSGVYIDYFKMPGVEGIGSPSVCQETRYEHSGKVMCSSQWCFCPYVRYWTAYPYIHICMSLDPNDVCRGKGYRIELILPHKRGEKR